MNKPLKPMSKMWIVCQARGLACFWEILGLTKRRRFLGSFLSLPLILTALFGTSCDNLLKGHWNSVSSCPSIARVNELYLCDVPLDASGLRYSLDPSTTCFWASLSGNEVTSHEEGLSHIFEGSSCQLVFSSDLSRAKDLPPLRIDVQVEDFSSWRFFLWPILFP